MRRRLFGGIAAAVIGLAVIAATAFPGAASAAAEGRVIHAADDPIKGHYVVFLAEGRQTVKASRIKEASRALAGRYGGNLRSVWETAVHGFSVTGMSERQARRLAANPTTLGTSTPGR